MATRNAPRVWVAYVLYFCGGIVGLHHVYLKRPHQCFLWSVSFGGYGVGLVRDFFAIPRYVREASECGSCRDERPSMGMAEVIGMLAFASHMGWLAKSVLPAAPSSEADHASYSLCTFALSVLGQTVGVWAVGNASCMKTVSFAWVLLFVSLAEMLGWLRDSPVMFAWASSTPQDGVVCVLGKSLVSIALLALSTLAVLAGAMYSRAWSAGQQTNRWKSAATCFVSVLAVWALVSTSWYVNGSFISDGERITFWDALGDLGRFLGGIVACLDDPSLEYCKDFGIVSDSTWRGRSAYEVLGLPHGAPHSQVRSKYLGALVWFPACLSVASLVALISHAQPSVMYIESSVVHFTALALATHPDKCGSCSDEEKKEMNEKFLQVNEAWEHLSKERRNREL